MCAWKPLAAAPRFRQQLPDSLGHAAWPPDELTAAIRADRLHRLRARSAESALVAADTGIRLEVEGDSAALALRAHLETHSYRLPTKSSASRTASAGVSACSIPSPSAPGPGPSTTTGRPRMRANATSASVPQLPPTATAASHEATTARFRAWPVPRPGSGHGPCQSRPGSRSRDLHRLGSHRGGSRSSSLRRSWRRAQPLP